MPEYRNNNRRSAAGQPAYPSAGPAGAGDGRRRRAAPKAAHRPGKPNIFLIVALSLALAGLAGLALAYADYAKAQGELKALRDERAAIAAKHEQDIQYYAGMRRRSGYKEVIDRYAQEFQVDPSFISAIIARESSYVPDAMAPSTGALGLMQVMKDTGEWVAMRLGIQNYSYDRLKEPELNIRFGAWYINYLSSHFNGDPVMIAAAYHAGANNVKQWALNNGGDQKTVTIEQIPKDNTRDYVKKVMNAYALYYEYDSGL